MLVPIKLLQFGEPAAYAGIFIYFKMVPRIETTKIMKSLRLSGVGLALFIGQVAHAQAVTNGDFGAGSPGTPTALANGAPGTSALEDWGTFYGSGGNGGNSYLDTSGQYGLTPSPGNASAYLLDLTGATDHSSGVTANGSFGEFGGIYQTVTGLTAGDTYALSFAIGSYSSYNYGDYLPGIEAAATGNVAGYFETNATVLDNNYWDSASYDFVAPGSSATVTLTGFAFNPSGPTATDISYAYIGLDDVSLSFVSAPNGGGNVPDYASSWLLLAIGLGGLATWKSRMTQRT